MRAIVRALVSVRPLPATTHILLVLFAALGLFTPNAVRAQPVEWAQIQPTMRSGPAMAYDSTRTAAVLFGGLTYGGTLLGDTWEWNGTPTGGTWSQRALGGPAPSPRSRPAMGYDSARGVTVLFGGVTGSAVNTPNGETWEWNGATWTRRFVTGPSPRSDHAMAYDSARRVTVLFGGDTGGGAGGTLSDETWEWNGTAWTRRIVAGPAARSQHAMAYDAARGVTVLFGGYRNGVENGETWEWNGTSWTQRPAAPPSAPSPRRGHTLAYDPTRSAVVLFGGYMGADFNNETWEWSGSGGGGWTRRTVGAPAARFQHGMVFDTARGVGVLFGGSTVDFYNGETWEWNSAGSGAWTMRVPGGPISRFNHGMTYDAARAVGVLFGGIARSEDTDETWEWNMGGGPNGQGAWTRRTPSGSSPSPRDDHAMVYDAARAVTLLFGGIRNNGITNGETWQWDGAGAGTWTQRPVSGPSPRYGHDMVYDAARAVVVLFGGGSISFTRNNETWEWDGNAWTMRTSTGPSPRERHAMAYDSARAVTVLFGGYTSSGVLSDETWEWDGNAWRVRKVGAAPAARYGHTMSYDSARAVTVLFSGLTTGNIRSNETWEFNGAGEGAWTLRLTNGPAPRNASAMIYDAAHGATVLFGGLPNGGETWQLRAACRCPADFNCDAAVNSADFFEYTVAFFALDPAADFNHSSTVNSQDFFDFLAAFFTGC